MLLWCTVQCVLYFYICLIDRALYQFRHCIHRNISIEGLYYLVRFIIGLDSGGVPVLLRRNNSHLIHLQQMLLTNYGLQVPGHGCTNRSRFLVSGPRYPWLSLLFLHHATSFDQVFFKILPNIIRVRASKTSHENKIITILMSSGEIQRVGCAEQKFS